MTFSRVNEGKVIVLAPLEKVVSKDLPVFYNPVMSMNRDIAVLLLASLRRKGLVASDPLAGTGIRSIRFLKELPGIVKKVLVNDGNPKFPALFKKQLKLNKLSSKKTQISRMEATKFLMENGGADYVDIDPFGTPNPFLDATCKTISRDGILAVTATDTGALAGTFPDACRRKYWAEPMKNEMMHEIGLRILIRKIQLIGMQYERALIPVFSHASDHYYRTYLHAEKSRKYVKTLAEQHGFLLYCPACMDRAVSSLNIAICKCGKEMSAAGPLWLGQLWNHMIVRRMLPKSSGRAEKLIKIIHKEAHIPTVGFVDIHRLCKLYKFKVPKTQSVLDALHKKKYHATTTHFSDFGIRTDAPVQVVRKIIQALGRGA